MSLLAGIPNGAPVPLGLKRHRKSTVEASAAGNYSVVVSNSTASVTSAPATLTVVSTDKAPVIITPPVTNTMTISDGATFSVDATGSPVLS